MRTNAQGANERVYTRKGIRCVSRSTFLPGVQYLRACRTAPQNESTHKHQRHAIYATETSGLLLIAFLLLVLTLVRYWHVIHWSVR